MMKKLYLIGIMAVIMLFGAQAAAASFLEIVDITVKVSGDKDSVGNDGGSINNVEPGDKIEIKLKIENTYPSSSADTEITDIEVTGDIEDIDDGDDLEPDEEPDEFDLDDNGDRETVTIDYRIPDRVDEEDFDLNITVEGRNNSGVDQTDSAFFTIEIDKEKHKLTINRANFDRESIACGRSTQFLVEIFNIGGEDEDDVELEIKNEELDIRFTEIFDVEEGAEDDDTEYSNTYTVRVPEDAKPQVYPFIVSVLYRDGREKESVTKDLLVTCDTTTTTPTTTTPAPVVTAPTPTTTTTATPTTTAPTPTVTTVQPTSGPVQATSARRSSDNGLGWVIAGYIIGIIVLIGLIAVIIKKRQ
tara:strand:- start:8489 stop:9565 length:1077 start_codon:yes stop_codon:yes gene_type:complete